MNGRSRTTIADRCGRARSTGSDHEPVEQIVLAALELGDLVDQGAAGLEQAVACRLASSCSLEATGVSATRARSAGVVGDLVDHDQLLVEHGQLGPGAHQPLDGRR